MLKCYDVLCQNGHISEVFVPTGADETPCPVCGTTSRRLPSATKSILEGITGHFPDAADRWARRHEEAARRPSSET